MVQSLSPADGQFAQDTFELTTIAGLAGNVEVDLFDDNGLASVDKQLDSGKAFVGCMSDTESRPFGWISPDPGKSRVFQSLAGPQAQGRGFPTGRRSRRGADLFRTLGPIGGAGKRGSVRR